MAMEDLVQDLKSLSEPDLQEIAYKLHSIFPDRHPILQNRWTIGLTEIGVGLFVQIKAPVAKFRVHGLSIHT